MAVLNRNELKEIDKKIDATITSQQLLSSPRDIAVIHILRYFEDYVRSYSRKTAITEGAASWGAAIKNGQDGMHFALNWIYRYCGSKNNHVSLDTVDNIYKQAHELHEAAMNYSIVWDLMTMLFKERAAGEQDKNGTIHVRYVNQLGADTEIADRFISAPDNPEIYYDGSFQLSESELANLLTKINLRHRGRTKVKYQISEETYQKTSEFIRRRISQLWELPESWDLGGYTVAQFREFCVSLATICFINKNACLFSEVEGGALDSVVLILQRKRWVNELARRSKLDHNTISKILDDLVYDPNLYASGSKQPDVTYQPFFQLNSGLLVLSTCLFLLSNAERNVWDLVSIKRERIHSDLRNEKEGLWLGELVPRMQARSLKAYSRINFAHNGSKSDVDLLVLDEKDKLCIAFQLKWLTSPDRIRDVGYTEKELQKGLDQAKLSLEWLNSRSLQLHKITELPNDELLKYEFKVIVLSKNTIGSGWVYKAGIPIINERLLNWILGDLHRKSLRALWIVGEERRYMPKRNEHFVDHDVEVKFGGLCFYAKNMGMKLKNLWNPKKDINVDGFL